jgi:hypothetical protein
MSYNESDIDNEQFAVPSSEVVKQWVVASAKLRKSAYIKDGILFLNEGRYQIPVNEINTPLKLLQWLYHLSEKYWADSLVIRRIIALIASDADISLRNTFEKIEFNGADNKPSPKSKES